MTINNKSVHCMQLCLIWILFVFSSISLADTEQIRVISNNDDAEELISDGDMYRDSSDLEFGYDDFAGGLQIVGIRFQKINIPQGATITSAYIVFETDETDSGTTNLVIFGEDEDDANQFNNSDNDISDNRTKTSASVDWNPSAWNIINELHQTPDVSTIVQEIVNRTGWTANNDLVFIVEPGSGCTTINCQRTAESHNGESSSAPLLVIDYTIGNNKLTVTTENVIQEYDVSSYGGSQDQTGTVEIRDSGLSLYLDGNRWQKIDFPYIVTANTIIEFDFQSTDQGEIHGLGFDNDLEISSDKSFQVYGSQNWGITNFGSAPYDGIGTTHFKISVGPFYTGAFQYLFFINDDDSNSTGNGLYSNVVVYEENTAPIAEYHFDETNWDGTGQVADNSSNTLNGTAVDDANTTNIDGGQVCRAANFDGSGDYIDVAGIDSYLNTTASLSFWINTSQIGNNTAWNAPGIIGVEQSGGGNDIFWGFIDGSGHIRIMKGNGNNAASINPINTGNWHHVVLTWDSSLGTVQVFVDGDFNSSATSETGDVSTAFSSIGQIKNNGLSFNGQLDELLIFDSVISANLVSSIYTNQVSGEKNYDGSARTCPEPIVHHYEIVHDSQGLTCDEETIKINACANENCSTLSAESTTLEFISNGTVITTPTFTGSSSIEFNNTTVETLTFSVANASIIASDVLVCDDGTGNSCDMAFANAGFRFLYGADNNTIIPNQTSGSVFGDTLKIQAVKDTNGVCTGLFTDDKDISLSQENVDPGGTTGLSFNININTNIEKHTSFTSTSLTFGADSIATISSPIYHDAGEIRLHANYDVDGVTVSGSSNSFWVSPAELVVSETSGTTHIAGEVFDLTVTAYNSQDVITPNYLPGQIEFKLERTGPTSNGVEGELTYGSGGFITSELGVLPPTFKPVTLDNVTVDNIVIPGVFGTSAAQYSEVGLINLDVQDSNYGSGITVDADGIDIGRFTPAYFAQTVTQGSLHADHGDSTTCPSQNWVYSGQLDETGRGIIEYEFAPVLIITPYNANGVPTENYIDDFDKLVASSISLGGTPITHDLALTSDVSTNGELSNSGDGVNEFTLSDTHSFTYTRNSLSETSPFIANFEIPVDSIIDGDSIAIKPTDTSVTPNIAFFENPLFSEVLSNSLTVNFGRWIVENTYGSETESLSIPMSAQYWNGTKFITNTDDNCSIISTESDEMTLTDGSLSASSTQENEISSLLTNGFSRIIELDAPTPDQGDVNIEFSVPTWLKYDWPITGTGDKTFDDNPKSVATFGVFRGNDRIISWREIGN